MENLITPTPLRYHRWLPYWAVLCTDIRQTLRSWVYRLWFLVTLATTLGYLVYRLGVYWEAGLIQSAVELTGELLRGMVLGSMALIVVLAVSAISAERGTLADSVLSRGISRYQYFLAKWHARLVVILGTISFIASGLLLSSHFLLDEGLDLAGSFIALLVVWAILFTIVSWGVALSALSSSTILGITLLWILLYGGGFLLTFLPAGYPSPERFLRQLPPMLEGHYSVVTVSRLLTVTGLSSLAAVTWGCLSFAHRDV